MLPSISLPFFFVTTIQRVLTRSRSFFLPSTLLIVQTCVYCFTALSPPPTTASEVSPPSICSNAPADVPDLYPTFSIPIFLSSDLVLCGELPLSSCPTPIGLQSDTRLVHYPPQSTSSPGIHHQIHVPTLPLNNPYNGIRKLLAASEPSSVRSIWTTSRNGQLILQ
jgi:hypothetical protein